MSGLPVRFPDTPSRYNPGLDADIPRIRPIKLDFLLIILSIGKKEEEVGVWRLVLGVRDDYGH
jgi:hypothetical protein